MSADAPPLSRQAAAQWRALIAFAKTLPEGERCECVRLECGGAHTVLYSGSYRDALRIAELQLFGRGVQLVRIRTRSVPWIPRIRLCHRRSCRLSQCARALQTRVLKKQSEVLCCDRVPERVEALIDRRHVLIRVRTLLPFAWRKDLRDPARDRGMLVGLQMTGVIARRVSAASLALRLNAGVPVPLIQRVFPPPAPALTKFFCSYMSGSFPR